MMMGAVYADVNDIIKIGKSLTAQQIEYADVLLEQASAKLRVNAKKYQKDIDAMIADNPDFALAVKSVVCQAVCRAIDSIDESSRAVSQASETIGSFSASVSYINGGQSLYFLRNELKELGLTGQRFGAIELY